MLEESYRESVSTLEEAERRIFDVFRFHKAAKPTHEVVEVRNELKTVYSLFLFTRAQATPLSMVQYACPPESRDSKIIASLITLPFTYRAPAKE